MDDRTNIPDKLKREDDDGAQVKADTTLKRKEREDDREEEDGSEPDVSEGTRTNCDINACIKPMMESLKKLLSKSTLYSKILQKKMTDPSPPPPPPKQEPKPEQKAQSEIAKVTPAPPPEHRKSSRSNAGVNAQKEKNRREAEMRREAIHARNKKALRSKRKKEDIERKERGTDRRTRARIEFTDSEEEQEGVEKKEENINKQEILYRDDLESDNEQSENDEPEKEDNADGDYSDKHKVVISSSSEEEDEEDEDESLPHYPGQPALVSGTELRDFQKNGVEWLSTLDSNGFSGILADEMGLGKTLQTITFLAKLIEDGSKGPFLIICPLSVVKNWIKEFAKFTPKLQPIMYHGDAKKRTAIRQEMKTRGFFNPKLRNKWALQPRIICTTYEMVTRDARSFRRIEWRYIVVDEGHRLRNMDTKLLKELKTLVSANRLIITGTPLQNNLKELWSLLNFCLPQLFDDLESFNTLFDFDRVNSDENGNPRENQNETVQLVSTLHEILRPFLLRRLKSDVAKGLPPKKEYVLYAPLTQKQKSVYDAILNRQIRSAISNLKTHGNINGEVNREEEENNNEVLAPRASKYRKNYANSDVMNIDDEKQGSEKPEPSNGHSKPISAYFNKSELDANEKTKTNEDDKDKIVIIEDSDDENKESQPKKGKSNDQQDTIETTENRKEDKMEDDDFEAMLIKEAEEHRLREEVAEGKRKSMQAARDAARKEIGSMKFENLVMQARKICAHPYIFHWDVDDNNEKTVGKDLVNASGKMMLCMRLLEELKARGHKTLIFSQFVTLLDILEGETGT